jgi:hypothetical protein
MHARRMICFLLGLWLGGAALMAWVARDNRHSVERLLAQPDAAAAALLQPLGKPAAGLLLRHQVFEQNLRLYRFWGTVQLALGMAFLFFILFGSREGKLSLLLATLMLAVAAAQLLVVAPELAALGRATDFLPPDALPPERYRLRLVLTGDKLAEALKGLLGLALALMLIVRRSRSSGDAGKDLDVINKANYRHVNR